MIKVLLSTGILLFGSLTLFFTGRENLFALFYASGLIGITIGDVIKNRMTFWIGNILCIVLLFYLSFDWYNDINHIYWLLNDKLLLILDFSILIFSLWIIWRVPGEEVLFLLASKLQRQTRFRLIYSWIFLQVLSIIVMGRSGVITDYCNTSHSVAFLLNFPALIVIFIIDKLHVPVKTIDSPIGYLIFQAIITFLTFLILPQIVLTITNKLKIFCRTNSH